MQIWTYRLNKIKNEIFGGGQNIKKLEEKYTFFGIYMCFDTYFQWKRAGN